MRSLRRYFVAQSPVEHSGMLFAVRDCFRFIPSIALGFLALLCVLGAEAPVPGGQQQSTSPPNPQAAQAPNQPATVEQKPVPPQAPSTSGQPAQTTPAPPAYTGPVIVLDPAHGGTDTGARGETGAIEKDLVLDYARVVKSELETQGFRVVLTRNDDSNPSYADRAGIANAYHNAIFISLHVASTGAIGTVHTYYYKFGSVPNGPPGAVGASLKGGASASSLVLWDEAQATHVDVSHDLADMLQVQLAQRASGSPTAGTAAAVRELRSVDAPAVAIEVSSVSVQDPNTLAALAAPLAVSIARGLEAFRAAASARAN
jgi:N-acetylmuramoyl-L-alanine amidase